MLSEIKLYLLIIVDPSTNHCYIYRFTPNYVQIEFISFFLMSMC